MFSKRVDRLTSSLIREILEVAQRPGVISFAGGLPAPDLLPSPSLREVPDFAAQYGPSEGEPELREAIAEYAQTLGIRCDASQVFVMSGSQQGIDLVSKLFIDDGTPIITESPTYLAALQSFRLFGARCLEVPVTERGLDPERLWELARTERPALAYLVPTFQNPAGTCYDAETRAEVARILDEFSIPLLEDEPYRDLVYDPCDRTPICSMLESAPWIYQGTFSKSFMPGIRVGFIIGSRDLCLNLVRLKQAADLHTNRLGQWLAYRWLVSDERETHLETLRIRYREKRDAMHSALQTHLGESAEWNAPAGGLFFWARFREPIDTQALLQRTLSRDVAFMPGDAFFAENPPPGHIRLNFSHATPEQMDAGLRVIAEEAVRAG